MSKNLKVAIAVFLLAMSSIGTGCYSYGALAAPSENTVVVARNSSFLTFIFPRGIYVCQVAADGLSNCTEGESP